MKKTIILTTALAFALSFGVAMKGFAADAGPADITMKSAKGTKPSKFPHKKHQETNKCGDCHHGKTADGKQEAYSATQKMEKCEACHTESMANPKLNSLQKAAHENCKGCHQKMEKNKGDLTKCTVCHAGGEK